MCVYFYLALRFEASLKGKRVRMRGSSLGSNLSVLLGQLSISLDNGHPSLYVVREWARYIVSPLGCLTTSPHALRSMSILLCNWGMGVILKAHHKDARVYILALRLEASLKWKRVRMTWHVVKRPFGDSDSPISLDNGHPSLYAVRGCGGLLGTIFRLTQTFTPSLRFRASSSKWLEGMSALCAHLSMLSFTDSVPYGYRYPPICWWRAYQPCCSSFDVSLRILCLTVTDTLQYGNGDVGVFVSKHPKMLYTIHLRIAVGGIPMMFQIGYKGTKK